MTLPDGAEIGSDSAPIQERTFPLMTRLPRRSIQLSPTAGSSNSNSFQHASSTRPLEKAVEVAKDAADQGKIEEVTKIIEGAINVLRSTSKIPARYLMAVGESLRVSESSLNFSEDLLEISEIFSSSDKMSSNSSRTIYQRCASRSSDCFKAVYSTWTTP